MNGDRVLRSRLRLIAETVLALVSIAACVAFVWPRPIDAPARPDHGVAPASNEPESLPPAPISVGSRLSEGKPDAPVVMIEYSDFECGQCATFAMGPLHTIENAYVRDGRLRYEFRHLPLEEHKHAFTAALVAECASKQGKFMELHDSLFEHSQRLTDQIAQQLGASVVADRERLSACVANSITAEQVRKDVSAATDLGIFQVPTIMVGSGQADGSVRITFRRSGMVSLDNVEGAIEDLLRQHTLGGRSAK